MELILQIGAAVGAILRIGELGWLFSLPLVKLESVLFLGVAFSVSGLLAGLDIATVHCL